MFEHGHDSPMLRLMLSRLVLSNHRLMLRLGSKNPYSLAVSPNPTSVTGTATGRPFFFPALGFAF